MLSLTFSERIHHCSQCGYTTDRDVAAAQVIEQRGLAATGLVVKLPVDLSERGMSNHSREDGRSRKIQSVKIGSPRYTA